MMYNRETFGLLQNALVRAIVIYIMTSFTQKKKIYFLHFLLLVQAYSRSNRITIHLMLEITHSEMRHLTEQKKKLYLNFYLYQNHNCHTSISSNEQKVFGNLVSIYLFLALLQMIRFLLKSTTSNSFFLFLHRPAMPYFFFSLY